MQEFFPHFPKRRSHISEVIPVVLNKANDNTQSYFFRWNDIRVEVFPNDTEQEIYNRYLLDAFKNGDFITKKTITKKH
jgi:hypothetical protein